MISEEWREQNRRLHESISSYGSSGGDRHWREVRAVMDRMGAKTVLDYGCGKGSLRRALGECVRNYDPAIPEWSAMPEPVDMVVCADVMEHVEPQFVDEVLEHIRGLSRKAAWFVISCRPAKKSMPDGRNAHISVHPPEWWRDRIEERFVVLEQGTNADHDAIFLTRPHEHHAKD